MGTQKKKNGNAYPGTSLSEMVGFVRVELPVSAARYLRNVTIDKETRTCHFSFSYCILKSVFQVVTPIYKRDSNLENG